MQRIAIDQRTLPSQNAISQCGPFKRTPVRHIIGFQNHASLIINDFLTKKERLLSSISLYKAFSPENNWILTFNFFVGVSHNGLLFGVDTF